MPEDVRENHLDIRAKLDVIANAANLLLHAQADFMKTTPQRLLDRLQD
jgi:hypothetical protein